MANTTLSRNLFGTGASLPTQILPISSKLSSTLQNVQEIAFVRDITRFDPLTKSYSMEKLYRIVSSVQMDSFAVLELFEGDYDAPGRTWQEEIVNAFPLMYARSSGFPKFKLTEGLWHVSSVEAIGSSVDLSWVAGENVARLVEKDIGDERKAILAT